MTKDSKKEPAHLAYVDVGTLLGHGSVRPQTALPQSASSGTVNNRYQPQRDELSQLNPVGTQKTLTQNRRSLDASPTLNGAMYLSQDQSKSSNDFIKTIDD